MQKAINYLVLGSTALAALASLLFFGLPYGSVEATVERWIAQAYPEDSQISGVVLYQNSTSGALSELPGVDVILYESIDEKLTVITQTVTSHAGAYLFSDLPIGNYYLGYFGKTPEGNLAYEYYNNTLDPNEASPFAITGGGTQIGVPTVILEGPAQPLGTIASGGGGQIHIDPITGQIFINRPLANISLEFANPCNSGTPSSISIFFNGRTFPLTFNSSSSAYRGTITQDSMTVDSADIFLDYTCPTRSADTTSGAVTEIVGRITQYSSNGSISSPLTSGPLEDALVSLYHMDGATPDSGTSTTGDCRTTDSRPQNNSWEGIDPATVDPGEFVIQSELRDNGQANPPVNPQETGFDGAYGWGLLPGCYYIVVSGDGFEDLVSPAFGVTNTQNVTDLNLELLPFYNYQLPTVSIDPDPFR